MAIEFNIFIFGSSPNLVAAEYFYNKLISKPCSITISASGLSSGVYIYALVLNGKIIKLKKLMIIK